MATNTPPNNKRRVPLGKPLDLNEKDLDRLSKIGIDDTKKAQALWRNTAPPEFTSLLDAQTVEESQ